MGQYIQSGICYKISVARSRMQEKNVSYDQFIEALNKEIDLNLYKVKETQDRYIFTLNDEILENGGLVKFLSEQYKLLNIDNTNAREIIDRLNEVKTANEIIEIAQEKAYQNFQYSNIYNNICCKPWSESVMVEYESIIFMFEGKIMMEVYDEFLVYIENLIKKDNPYEISKAIKVLIG